MIRAAWMLAVTLAGSQPVPAAPPVVPADDEGQHAAWHLEELRRVTLVGSGARCGRRLRAAVVPGRGFYLADYETRAVHLFDEAGAWVRTFGNEGPNAVRMPWAVTESHGHVYVADPGQKKLLVLDLQGRFERAIDQPEGAVLVGAADGGLLVGGLREVEPKRPRWFHMFKADGSVSWSALAFGDIAGDSISYGVDKPGACAGPDGSYYVLRPTEYAIHWLSKDGVELGRFGGPPATYRAPAMPEVRPYSWDKVDRRRLRSEWTILEGLFADRERFYVRRIQIHATEGHHFLVDVLARDGRTLAADLETPHQPIGADPVRGLWLLDVSGTDLAAVLVVAEGSK